MCSGRSAIYCQGLSLHQPEQRFWFWFLQTVCLPTWNIVSGDVRITDLFKLNFCLRCSDVINAQMHFFFSCFQTELLFVQLSSLIWIEREVPLTAELIRLLIWGFSLQLPCNTSKGAACFLYSCFSFAFLNFFSNCVCHLACYCYRFATVASMTLQNRGLPMPLVFVVWLV